VTPEVGREIASGIRLIALDVDGVLTDAHLVLGPDGEEYKQFSARDGIGIKLAQRAGIVVAFVSARESEIVTQRAQMLGVREVHQGVRRKLEAIGRIAERLGIGLDGVAFVGDDVMDIPPVESVGMGVAVGDACEDLKRAARFVAAAPGGGGAVRETVEAVLRARGDWDDVLRGLVEELKETG
jgi:3-deoxy-D-manno-octulosonate 8-phosphate phosphatase (KDO 8-P phosphatase)